MKKQVSFLLGAVAMLGAAPAIASTNFGPRSASNADLTGMPATRDYADVDYQKYQTYTTTTVNQARDGRNIYYSPATRRSEMYKQYDNAGYRTVQTTRSETVRNELRRKYFLAHPFFQPIKGKFGSVTDLSYSMNSYNAELTPFEDFTIESVDSKWKSNQFSIKQDFSFGITDTIALQAMAQYDFSKYKVEWDNADTPTDTMKDNALNIWGVGAQWRFVDSADWIATASAYYEKQKDFADNLLLELKAGYKISSTTIYGLARGWYVDFKGNSYGNFMAGETAEGNTEVIMLAYKEDVDNAWYIEGGIGTFSVLDENWTLNLEATFGDYDWHNQLSLKGAIGWQPNDWFALNLYGRVAVYDSADNKKVGYWGYGVIDSESEDGAQIADWVKHGTAKISKYSETKIGVQAIFMF